MAVQVGDLVAKLSLDQSSFTAGLSAARTKIGNLGGDFLKAGAGLTAGITLPIVAIGTSALNSAIEFESSFTGIRKTVNATEEEFAKLEEGMRALALIKPVDINELNKIGEAAGQLGIQTDKILEFTSVMADLGVTTNLSSDQAATSLARFVKVMGTSQDEFENLGSTIVALGNNFETTEAEIVEMAARLSGAGKTVGLTESQVFGLATALTSVGVNAEAGGTAMSRVLKAMAVQIATTGDQLDLFAEVSGKTTKEFAASFRDDAGKALLDFVRGLGDLQKEGDAVLVTLEDLELDSVRISDSLLRLASSGDAVDEAFTLAAKAFEENTALAKEAELRYATTQSQMELFTASIEDVKITLGQALIPALTSAIKAAKPMIEMFANIVKAFSAMDDGTKKTVLIFVGAFAAGGPILIVLGAAMAAIAVITAPMLAGGAMIIGLVAGIGTIIANWKELKEAGTRIWTALFDFLSGKTADATRIVSRMWKLFVANIKKVINDLAFEIKDRFGKFGEFMLNPMRAATKGVLNVFKSLSDKLVGRSIIPDMIDASVGEFQRLNTELVGGGGIVPITVDQVIADFQLMSSDSLSVGAGFRESMVKEFETMDDQIARAAVPSMTEGVTDSFQVMTTRVTQTIMPQFVEGNRIAVDETKTLWQEMSESLSSSMSSAMSEMVTGVLRGTQDMGDLLTKFNDNILLKFGDDAFKRLEARLPQVAQAMQATLLGVSTAIDIGQQFAAGDIGEGVGGAAGAIAGGILGIPGGPLGIAIGASIGNVAGKIIGGFISKAFLGGQGSKKIFIEAPPEVIGGAGRFVTERSFERIQGLLQNFREQTLGIGEDVATLRGAGKASLIGVVVKQLNAAEDTLLRISNIQGKVAEFDPNKLLTQADIIRTLIKRRADFEIAGLRDVLAVIQQAVAENLKTVTQWAQSLASLDDQIRSMQLSTLSADDAFARIRDEFQEAVALFRQAPTTGGLADVQKLASEFVSATEKAFGETDQGRVAATTQDVIDTLRNLRDVTIRQQASAQRSLEASIDEQTEIERQIVEISNRAAGELVKLNSQIVNLLQQQGFIVQGLENLNISAKAQMASFQGFSASIVEAKSDTDRIIDAIQGTTNAVNNVTFNIPAPTVIINAPSQLAASFTPARIFGPSGTGFTALAHGGLVTQPTAAIIGEAGPEAVIPLDQLGIGTTNITVTGNTFLASDTATARELARLLKPHIDSVRTIAVR